MHVTIPKSELAKTRRTKMNKTISLYKAEYENKNITDEELCVIASIRIYSGSIQNDKDNPWFKNMPLHIDTLLLILQQKPTSRLRECIKSLLKSLEEKKYITINQTFGNSYLLNVENIAPFNNKKFVNIPCDKVFIKIMSDSSFNSGCSLLRLYCFLKGSYRGFYENEFKENKLAYKFNSMSTDKMTKLLNVSSSTLSNRMNKLKELGVISIIKIKPFVYNNGLFNYSSWYCDKENEDLLKEYIEKHTKYKIKTRNNTADRDRSITMKYRWLKQGKEYPLEELEVFAQDCKDYNKAQLEKQRLATENNRFFTPNILDLELFRQKGIKI